ncbi:MAG: hypothetical protein RSC33_04215 [Vagococcus sp.]
MGLIEVVASVVMLGILLPGVAYLFVFSQSVLRSNQARSEGIQVAEDIKQVLEYRSQTQDIADLNRLAIVEINDSVTLDEATQMRRDHLIIDNTGIQYESKNQPLYGEVPIEEIDGDKGEFLRKISYTKEKALPESLNTRENQLYMGNYLTWSKEKKTYEPTPYLVRIDVEDRDKRIEEAVNLEIGVWDERTGSKLYSTVYKWVVKF